MSGQRFLTCLLFLGVTDMVVDSKVRIDPRRNDLKEPLPVPGPPGVPSSTDLGPHFAPDSPRLVTAAVGAPALLPCKPRSLGSKSVSWIRHRDLHVLTVGSFTFTNDKRFSAHRDPATGDWTLVLRHPQPADSGSYDCSISTKPVTSLTVRLSVVVPSAELVGDGNVYLDHGSTLNLTCMVHFSPTPPEFILWYHKDKLVNYGQAGRAISVETQHEGDITRSSLLLFNATRWDSGHYSCKPSNADKVSTKVHVLKSKTPAAMQTTSSASLPPGNSNSFLLLFLLLLFLSSLHSHRYGPWEGGRQARGRPAFL